MNNHLPQSAIMLSRRETASIVSATGLIFEQLKLGSQSERLVDVLISHKGGIWGETSVPGIGYPVLRSSDMRGKRVDVSNAVWCSIPSNKAQGFSLDNGDILVTKSSGSSDLVGKAAIFFRPDDGNTYLFSNFTLRIRPDITKVYPEYLAWFLRSPQSLMWRYANQQNAVGLRNLQTKEFLGQLVPLPSLEIQEQIVQYLNFLEAADEQAISTPLPPSLDEQRRIVARIEALAARVSEAQRLRQEAIEEAELIWYGILARAYNKALNIAGGIERLDDVCTLITDGTHVTPTYVSEGIPFISVKDITSGTIKFDNVKFITPEEHAELSKRCNPKRGDVLLTKVGTTGFAKAVDVDREFSIFVSVALLKINRTRLDPLYTEFMLNSPIIRGYSAEGTRGVGNKNLVLKFIKEFPIPVPPLEEQHNIVLYLNSMKAQIGSLNHVQSETQRELDALLPSILDRAFKGEL